MSDAVRPFGAREASVVPASGPAAMDCVRTLFREYQAWLGVDLCFQGFAEEIASLPGAYAPPRGGLWFARLGNDGGRDGDGEIAGVVGLRPLPGNRRCELKRLWIRPAFRGLGLGRRLAETAIAAARAAGYRRLCLDTLPQMAEAHRLYGALGFHETAPYYDNPLDGVVYMELDITRATASRG